MLEAVNEYLRNCPEEVQRHCQRTGVLMDEILKQLNQEGRTVILITHDDSIARSAQRIIRIQDGKIAKNCALAFIDNSPDYAIMDAGFEKAKTLP